MLPTRTFVRSGPSRGWTRPQRRTAFLELACLLCLLWNGTNATCAAQSERYELGQRLRRFELAWQSAGDKPRKASATAMQRAVQSFFGLQLSTAASHLDQAYFLVRDASPSIFERAALAQRIELRPVLLSADNAATQIRLKAFYKLRNDDAADNLDGENREPLADSQLLLHLQNASGEMLADLLMPVSEIRERMLWRLPELTDGDYWVVPKLVSTAEQVELPRLQLSLLRDVDGRITKLNDWLAKLPATTELSDEMNTLRATVRQTVQTLRAMSKGEPQEIDFPAHRLLTLAEKLIATPDDASKLLQAEANDTAWIVLSNGRRSLPIRMHLPVVASLGTKSLGTKSSRETSQETTTAGRPILFAFHGAGGSENMFFETYGAGRLIELASQRGWIVVSARHPLLGMPLNYREMIELLKPFFPIDDRQVFLLGHSMGAGEVVRQMSLELAPPQAAVAIGGGGRSTATNATRNSPWWIAAGELDFGRGSARSLANQLKQFGCRVDYREYADVEHMVIVQAALDDVFTFLDDQSASDGGSIGD